MITKICPTCNSLNVENYGIEHCGSCGEYIGDGNEYEVVEITQPTEPKYTFGDYVECTGITKENHEKLQRGKVYEIAGNSIMDGNVVYAVKDEAGNLYYSMDRFKKVGHRGATPRPVEPEEMCCKLDTTAEPTSGKVDMVNHPNHYTAGGMETIDFLEAKLGEDGFIGFLQGNVLKYMSRVGKKFDDIEDLKKARWYLNRLIKTLDGEEEPVPVDEAVNRPMTKRQKGYIAGLCKELDIERTDLPPYVSPVADYHELTEAEAIKVIDRLICLKEYFRGLC